ncbi:MAG: hypothetical protein U5L04_05845 [Trueperaceae bacterium]|nr:hypothetical protein [Trueperaceae bacterium]
MNRVLLSLVVFALCGGAFAQAQFGLSPLSAFASLERGQSSVNMTVRNPGTEPLRIRVSAEPFTYASTGLSQQNVGPGDATPYVQIAPREFTLAPGTSQRVRVVARIPPSLGLAEYRSLIVAERLTEPVELDDTDRAEGEVRAVTAVNARFGATLYFVTSAATPGLEALSARVENGEIRLSVRNQGSGSARVATKYQIEQDGVPVVTDSAGRISVIAASERSFQIGSAAALDPGSYVLRGTLLPFVGNNQADSVAFAVPLVVPELPDVNTGDGSDNGSDNGSSDGSDGQ